MIYLFTFMFAVVGLNFVRMVAIICHSDITLPHYKQLSPSSWLIFYPSLLFQIWFWVDRSGMLA